MKKLNKYIISAVLSCLMFLLTISPVTAFALSNGKDFKDQGKNPLAVTVSYYSDALSRGVAWTTMTATNGVLEVVPASSEAQADWSNATVIPATRKVEDSTYYTYTAYIENLTEENYCYRVGSSDGSAYSEVGTFTVDHDQSEINFIYATDSQDYDEEGFSQWANLVEVAYQTMPEAQFFGMGGDIVNNSHDEDDHDLDQWIYALDLPKENFMHSVFMPVSGNHDKLDETFCNRFAIDYQGSRDRGGYYSFDYGNMHFVGLNTNESGDALNVQLEWLKTDLGQTDKQWKVVMMHKGIVSTGDHSNDSDVRKIREAILPIMAEYKVDMVLQGHDHCYVRSKPYYYGQNEFGVKYNGTTPNQNETLITETVNGKSVTYSVEPNGTFYATANYAGRKSYAPVDYDTNLIFPAINPYNGLYMSQQIQLQTFITVKISGNALYFNTYLYDGKNVTLYDTYNVIKDTHKVVEEQISALPTVEQADIFDYENIQQVKTAYEKLIPNAVKNVNAELKAKLNALTTEFSAEKCEEAYEIVCDILNLGNVTAEKQFMDKIKSIKRKYADLNEIQAEYVVNYSEIAQKEAVYKDMLYALAVSNLAYKCSINSNNVSAYEVYLAYNALTEEQKAYVNLHGVNPPSAEDINQGAVGGTEEKLGCASSLFNSSATFALLILCVAICILYKKSLKKGE